MFELVKSSAFDAWLRSLHDIRAKARIAARLDRVADGNFGDVKVVGGGVNELRIDYGPGYRVSSCGAVQCSWWYWPVATNAPNTVTLRRPNASQLNGSKDHERRTRELFPL